MQHTLNPNPQLRIFISSTFRDMQQEREELIKHVFQSFKKVPKSRDNRSVDPQHYCGGKNECSKYTQKEIALPIFAEIAACLKIHY